MNYKATMKSITDSELYTCPVVVVQDVVDTTLILNCTELLQPHQLFVVEISGSNPAGTSTVVGDIELSKYANITMHLSVTDAYSHVCVMTSKF